MMFVSPHREEYGKLFDFVNAKKLNIKNRGLKEVSVGRMCPSPVLSVEEKGAETWWLLFHSFSSLLTLIEKRGACGSFPFLSRFSLHGLRSVYAAS